MGVGGNWNIPEPIRLRKAHSKALQTGLMAKSRSTRSNLYQLLNEAHRPIYVLDGKGCIVFANRSLCRWLGAEADQLETLECVWTTDRIADENLNRVRGLAAPSEAQAADLLSDTSETSTGWAAKVFRTAADGHLIYRNAEFFSLGGHSGVTGELLACVSAVDLSNNSDSASSSTHELINQLRTAQTQKFGFDYFVGVSPQAQLLSRQIAVASETDCNLMIVGEPGSEREQLARAIHVARQDVTRAPGKQNRNASELYPIHCAVADAQLVQTTVMQVHERAGQGGCLLLLEVDRLTVEATQELRGFLELDRSQLRTIATCADLHKVPPQIAEKTCVMKLDIAPLRKRKTDLPLLAQMVLTASTKNSQASFDEPAMQRIVDYDWPGNLEELKRTIEEIEIKTDQNQVSKNELPERFEQSLLAQQIGRPQIVEIKLDEYLADIELQLIQRAMAIAGNNKAQACKLLGISRAKLGRRIGQLAGDKSAEEPIVFEETAEEEIADDE